MARRKEIKEQSVSTSACAAAAFVRRHCEIRQALLLDKGGADHCSESLKQLVKRFATVSALAERFEAQVTLGQKVDVTEYCQLCNVSVRIARAVGIDRAKSDAEPRLVDLLRSQEKE
jgi:hypothetical protein